MKTTYTFKLAIARQRAKDRAVYRRAMAKRAADRLADIQARKQKVLS